MEAKFEQRGEVVLVELNGRLDFETAIPFRRTCMGPLAKQKVVFDLSRLNFVGSLGLQTFVDTLDHMTQNSATTVKFCGVSSEFKRMFDASGIQQVYENAAKALESF